MYLNYSSIKAIVLNCASEKGLERYNSIKHFLDAIVETTL